MDERLLMARRQIQKLQNFQYLRFHKH